MNVSQIRAHIAHATDCLMAMPDHALEILWLKFSEIQQASEIEVTAESCARFEAWFESGNPEDAWS